LTHSFPHKEGDLVTLLKQKNIPAFQQLYDQFAPALYSTILQIIRDQVVASNVLQNVFVSAWRNIETYDPSRKRLFTWMLNIARCSALDETKKTNGSALPAEFLPAHAPETVGGVNTLFDECGLKQAVQKLSEAEKQLIELCYYGGMSHEQITNKLGIPLTNVKPRLRSALSELRTLL